MGEVFVWHDILYDGPRNPGWPTATTLSARADFLDETTGGGLGRHKILETLRAQYRKLKTIPSNAEVTLWFDACLFDQTMLAHILTCLKPKGLANVTLICIDAYPDIVPYHGLGQLPPEHLAAVYPQRQAVRQEQFIYAEQVDRAFALQDISLLHEVASYSQAPLPWLPAAILRWLEEQSDEVTGLGLLERLTLTAIRSGCRTPADIFASVADHDTPPQYWGDITLWAKINGLATREPPLVTITGPTPLLPQWNCQGQLDAFRIYPTESNDWRQ
jgi:hypothetical protein